MSIIQRSKHLPYELSETKQIDHAIRQDAILKLADIALQGVEAPKIMDIGSGRGELISRLKDKYNAEVYGIDIDPICIELSKAYGNIIRADMDDQNEELNRQYSNFFDLVICSHVLEHLKRPYDSMKTIRNITKQFIILAVPNPHAMLTILNLILIRRLPKVAEGHVYSWDGPHFVNFLEGQVGLKIEKWASDRVTFVPGKMIRDFMARIHLLKMLDGKLLPEIFPFASESLIALCRKIN